MGGVEVFRDTFLIWAPNQLGSNGLEITLRDDAMSGGQDRSSGPIVLLQVDGFGSWKVLTGISEVPSGILTC